jgi:hypothetical protein
MMETRVIYVAFAYFVCLFFFIDFGAVLSAQSLTRGIIIQNDEPRVFI